MATLSTIVGGLQTALTTGASPVFTATTCFFSFDPRKALAYPPADQFAVIQPNDLKVKNRVFKGGGNINYTISWDTTIWLFVRFAVDVANRVDSYLLDATYGSLVLTDSVMEALQSFTNTEGNNLWGYQLDSIDWQTEERNDVGWAVTKMKFHTDVTGR